MDLWQITGFTIAAALGATALMLPPGLMLAWLLARQTFRGRALVETFVSLPLVMPPVATGLILLMLFAPRGPIGRVLARLGIEVVFTWKAVVLAMAVMGASAVREDGSRGDGAGRPRATRRWRRRSARGRCASSSRSPFRSPRQPSWPAPCSASRARSASSARRS